MTMPTHALVGGGAFLSYELLREFMRHHQDTLRRPEIVDHTLAFTILGMAGSVAFFPGTIGQLALNGAVAGHLAGLGTWWISQ